MAQLNKAEQRFAAYLDDYGFGWKYEPDYQEELGLPQRLVTTPDFLIERDGHRAVAEVRQFETTALADQMSSTGRAGVVGPEKLFGAQRSAMFEKAKQLRPLAGAGVPLLVVLANPLQRLVPLDDFHVQAAMWGNPGVVIPIDTTSGGRVEGHEPYLQLENYGAFASPVIEDEKLVGWQNRHPHVTAVLVVHERLFSADWREEILAGYRSSDRSIEAAVEDTFKALQDVAAAQARGEEPQGSYRWVSVYETGSESAVALPASWFDGPRDERYGPTEAGYGRLRPEADE